MNKSTDNMQAKLEAIARSVGLTWEHVQGMTFRRFAEMVERERVRRASLGETPTMPGVGS